MSTAALLNSVLSALVLGSIYSLVTLGYVVVYRTTRVFNFLHPDLMLIGALLYTSFYRPGWIGFAIAFGAACAVTILVGTLVYYLVMARCAGIPHWVQMILTMGLSIMAINIAQLIWGSNFRFVHLPINHSLVWGLPGGATLAAADLMLFVVSTILSAMLYWVLTRSPVAPRLIASADQPRLAAYSGVRITLWFGIAWAVAAFCAAVGGILYASRGVLSTELVDVGLVAFPAAMIGGMDSVEGAFVGGLVLALIQQSTSVLWGSQIATPVAFVLVFAILIVRPRGLFGARAMVRV